MYCPQCGVLNGKDASACLNCGAALAMELPSENRSSLGWSIASLGMGLISFWPYPFLLFDLYHIPSLRPFLSNALNLGCLGGAPLGLGAMLLGMLAWRRSRKLTPAGVLSVLGILLGVGGIAGHIWFIATCQFCQ